MEPKSRAGRKACDRIFETERGEYLRRSPWSQKCRRQGGISGWQGRVLNLKAPKLEETGGFNILSHLKQCLGAASLGWPPLIPKCLPYETTVPSMTYEASRFMNGRVSGREAAKGVTRPKSRSRTCGVTNDACAFSVRTSIRFGQGESPHFPNEKRWKNEDCPIQAWFLSFSFWQRTIKCRRIVHASQCSALMKVDQMQASIALRPTAIEEASST